MLVHCECKETDNPLVATVLCLEYIDELAISLELDKIIKTCGLLLDRVGKLLQAPVLFVHHLTAILFDEADVLTV